MGTDSTREPRTYTARQMVYAYTCGALLVAGVWLFTAIIH